MEIKTYDYLKEKFNSDKIGLLNKFNSKRPRCKRLIKLFFERNKFSEDTSKFQNIFKNKIKKWTKSDKSKIIINIVNNLEVTNRHSW